VYIKFWNATDACCNFYSSTVDDSKYLSDLITEMIATYNVDVKRVYLIGHSNGGFMAHRMACEHGNQIAAIVSVSGALWNDTTKCPATSPVSVVEIHGTKDQTINYSGGEQNQAVYPSALSTVGFWAKNNKCAAPQTATTTFDLDLDVAGADTTVTRYPKCSGGTTVALWSIEGGSHDPEVSPAFASTIIDSLYTQQKP
jgi:polyhydroxybutyrate depolymerase